MTLNLKKMKVVYYKRSLLTFLLIVQIIIFSAVSASAVSDLPSLPEAESMIGDGPEVLAAIAAMGRDVQLAELERQRMGAKYFVSTTFGYSDEPLFETSEESASYSKLGVGAGLVFPILGTWSKQ